MGRGPLAMLVTLLLAAPAAGGAALVLRIDDGRAPLADAVVELTSPDASAPAAAAAPHVVDQKDETFVPYVTLARRGESVVFRNSDYTRHHVYTFSPVHPFEFVVPSGSSSEPVQFGRTGVAAIGCNIHDRMIAYVFVTDAAFAARSGPDGLVAFDDVPAGTWRVRAWHPRLRAAGRGVELDVVVTDEGIPDAGTGPLGVSLRVDAAPPGADRERTSY